MSAKSKMLIFSAAGLATMAAAKSDRVTMAAAESSDNLDFKACENWKFMQDDKITNHFTAFNMSRISDAKNKLSDAQNKLDHAQQHKASTVHQYTENVNKTKKTHVRLLDMHEEQKQRIKKACDGHEFNFEACDNWSWTQEKSLLDDMKEATQHLRQAEEYQKDAQIKEHAERRLKHAHKNLKKAQDNIKRHCRGCGAHWLSSLEKDSSLKLKVDHLHAALNPDRITKSVMDVKTSQDRLNDAKEHHGNDENRVKQEQEARAALTEAQAALNRTKTNFETHVANMKSHIDEVQKYMERCSQ